MAAACYVIVKNEQESILEWVAYHSVLGFDAFIVQDDHSSDGTRAQLDIASQNVDVRVTTYDKPSKGMQAQAYVEACSAYRDEFEWMAFVDADEFIVPSCAEHRIVDLLSPRADDAAVALPWRMFGSSGHKAKPAGLMIEAYQCRAPSRFDPNRHVKSIVRPSLVRGARQPHSFEVVGRYSMPDGSPAVWRDETGGILQSDCESTWQINHYFTRSEEHWHERLQRGQLGNVVRTMSDFHHYDRNDVVDSSAAAFASAVKEKLRDWGAGLP